MLLRWGTIVGAHESLHATRVTVESTVAEHRRQAQLLLDAVLKARAAGEGPDGGADAASPLGPRATFRVGIAGPPGAGKSTFIEALGLHLVTLGHRPAVIAIGAWRSTRVLVLRVVGVCGAVC